MKCVICKKGETSPGKATITLNRNGTTVVVRNVPAEVCQNCGEEYVDNKTAADLLKNANLSTRQGSLVDIREYKAA